jgi:hypothetical protein
MNTKKLNQYAALTLVAAYSAISLNEQEHAIKAQVNLAQLGTVSQASAEYGGASIMNNFYNNNVIPGYQMSP